MFSGGPVLLMEAAFILKPTVQTAKHAKYAERKGGEWTRTFTRWENPSSLPLLPAFAGFAHFAVPSAFSRFIGSRELPNERESNRASVICHGPEATNSLTLCPVSRTPVEQRPHTQRFGDAPCLGVAAARLV